MTTLQVVVLVLHLMIAAGLVGIVLLQRSEGGALGIGGGGGGGFMTGRGTANLLTRMTAALAAAFFATSLTLTLLAQSNATVRPIVGTGSPATAPAAPGTPGAPGAPPTAPAAPGAPAAPTSGGILERLQPSAPATPAPPPSK